MHSLPSLKKRILVKLMTSALLTDLYEVTMAYGYWKLGMAEHEAVFNLFFRKRPFGGGYALAAGLEEVIHLLSRWHFSKSDLDYLSSLESEEGTPLFEERFLTYLEGLRFGASLDAVAEGEVVFPYEPLVRVQGPLIQCQLLETLLLTIINFSSLIATKASRVVAAACGDPVIEFGMRRAQGLEAAHAAARAAFIGGCKATSNTYAGRSFGIPVKGTHAHSWIMAFDSEEEAFEAYASALPHNLVFLVDTYDTIEGVKRVIEIGKRLRERGRSFLGIRLDSGDLAVLSREARALLDASGFHQAKIMASNELDEERIEVLKAEGAQISLWGVGTRLVTGYPQGALDGVYKLSAIREAGGEWRDRLKLSDRREKISDPGILQVRRFSNGRGQYLGDMVYDIRRAPSTTMHLRFGDHAHHDFTKATASKDLLIPIFDRGRQLYTPPSLCAIQCYAQEQLERFEGGVRRLKEPGIYPVGLEESYFKHKEQLVRERGG